MKHLFRQHRQIIILAGLLALGLISGTIAWLSSLSSATNSFTVGTVDVTATESFDDYVKSNVGAQNSGNPSSVAITLSLTATPLTGSSAPTVITITCSLLPPILPPTLLSIAQSSSSNIPTVVFISKSPPKPSKPNPAPLSPKLGASPLTLTAQLTRHKTKESHEKTSTSHHRYHRRKRPYSC